MRKCPRCDHEVNEQDRYCPHCGFDLQRRYVNMNRRKLSFLPYILILLAFAFLPLLYSYAFEGITSSLGGLNTVEKKEGELPEVQDVVPTRVLTEYDTLADFSSHYTNVSAYINDIENYEKALHDKGDYIFDKEYIIQIYDNYNVAFQMTYTVSLSDQYDLKVVKMFDRKKTVDKEEVTFVKKNLKSFEELLLTEEEKKLLNTYIQDDLTLNKALEEFSTRKEDFEKKKEKLGHYGMGVYHDCISYVVERYDQQYQVKIKYSK